MPDSCKTLYDSIGTCFGTIWLYQTLETVFSTSEFQLWVWQFVLKASLCVQESLRRPFGSWILASGSWILDSGLWTVNCEFSIMNYELWIMNYELWIVNCELWLMIMIYDDDWWLWLMIMIDDYDLWLMIMISQHSSLCFLAKPPAGSFRKKHVLFDIFTEHKNCKNRLFLWFCVPLIFVFHEN